MDEIEDTELRRAPTPGLKDVFDEKAPGEVPKDPKRRTQWLAGMQSHIEALDGLMDWRSKKSGRDFTDEEMTRAQEVLEFGDPEIMDRSYFDEFWRAMRVDLLAAENYLNRGSKTKAPAKPQNIGGGISAARSQGMDLGGGIYLGGGKHGPE